MEAIAVGLTEYKHKESQANFPSEQLDEWETKVLARCRENLLQPSRATRLLTPDPYSDSTRLALRELHSCFVIAPVDKSQHNLAITCKRWYQTQLLTELSSNAYSSEHVDTGAILQQHAAWSSLHNYSPIYNLRYLYGTIKMHKSPPRLRFIAGTTHRTEVQSFSPLHSSPQQEDMAAGLSHSRVQIREEERGSGHGVSQRGEAHAVVPSGSLSSSMPPNPVRQRRPAPPSVSDTHNRQPFAPESSTTAPSIITSKCLQQVMHCLQRKDNTSYISSGFRRYFVVHSPDEAFSFLKENIDALQGHRLRTFDFTTMYSKLPQQDLIRKVCASIDEAAAHFRASASPLLPADCVVGLLCVPPFRRRPGAQQATLLRSHTCSWSTASAASQQGLLHQQSTLRPVSSRPLHSKTTSLFS
jgi:hypothetical protein